MPPTHMLGYLGNIAPVGALCGLRTMDPEQLRQTIASAQAGEAEGFQTLLETYGPRLYGYFYKATNSHHEVEDLLGEISLRLVKQLKKYDHRDRFEPWLFRIAANMVRDRIRRLVSRPRPVSLSTTDKFERSLEDRLSGKDESVDSRLLASEASGQLDSALQTLDETTREMVLLRYFGELSFKELADRFHCPLGTVLAKVHRGLRALKKVMNDDAVD